MKNNLLISKLTQADAEAAFQLFEIAVPDAFEKEGLGYLKEEIQNEVKHKRQMIEASLRKPDSDILFLIAKLEGALIGAISFGACGEDIRKCTDNQLAYIGELGSLFVLPDQQDKGVGSALISAMMKQLSEQGIDEFCLDSGYKRAQKRWLRKFGTPYKVAKDYWGPEADHMIWLCKVCDFI